MQKERRKSIKDSDFFMFVSVVKIAGRKYIAKLYFEDGSNITMQSLSQILKGV